jgi:DNA repair protein RadC
MIGGVRSEMDGPTGEAELLARALGGASPAADLSVVANRVARIPWWERRALDAAGLTREHGVSRERAERLAAMWELAERWTDDDRPAIGSPRDALLMLDGLRRARREQVVVLLLDARHRPIKLETVAVGTINASRLQPCDVFGPALRSDAVAVIIGHNHPSGDPAPSRADRAVTTALRSAGALLGIPVLDHLIVARRGHHSFRETESWDEAA